jgi:DNA-3-methyladenine glycosylase II
VRPSPLELSRLRRRDPALAHVLARIPAFPQLPDAAERRRTHFESLARAIVHQQLAGAAAATIWARVLALAPGRRSPSPEQLLELSDLELRGAGLSAAKASALRDLARRLVARELRLRAACRLPDEEVIARLITVRGVGVWSAQMFLLFRLGRLDVLPTTDLGVREGLRLLDGREARPTPTQVEARAALWRPLRSVGSWAMWRLVELERARAVRGGAR